MLPLGFARLPPTKRAPADRWRTDTPPRYEPTSSEFGDRDPEPPDPPCPPSPPAGDDGPPPWVQWVMVALLVGAAVWFGLSCLRS